MLERIAERTGPFRQETNPIASSGSFDGEIKHILGRVNLQINIGGQIFSHTLHVFQHLHTAIIIGLDFLTKFESTICTRTQTLSLRHGVASVALVSPVLHSLVRCKYDVTLAPNSQTMLPVKVSKTFPDNCMVLLQPNFSQNKFLGAKVVNKIKDGQTSYLILNPYDRSVFLRKNSVLGTCTNIQEADIIDSDDPSIAF